MAKERHRQIYGDTVPINRVKIRKFKRELRRQMNGESSEEEEKVKKARLIQKTLQFK